MVNGSFVEMLHFTQSALSFTFSSTQKEKNTSLCICCYSFIYICTNIHTLDTSRSRVKL